MKVPPKRKGNDFDLFVVGFGLFPSMKVPPKRKGNVVENRNEDVECLPSMKVPPKRKGNSARAVGSRSSRKALNESPSEKEGKFSLKVPSAIFFATPQ